MLREHREEEDAMTRSFPQLPNVRSGNDLLDVTAGTSTGNGGSYGSTCGSASTSQSCLAKDAVVVVVPTKSVGEDGDEVEGGRDEESAPLIDGFVRKKRTSPKLGTQHIHDSSSPSLAEEYFFRGPFSALPRLTASHFYFLTY